MVRKIEACGVEKDTMINNLIIRQETEEDYKKTELMIMRSFWNKYWPGCTEHLSVSYTHLTLPTTPYV